MTTFEWFLLIVVVIGVPLVVAVVVTLWTLEQARQRTRKNRTGGSSDGPDEPGMLVKRNALRVGDESPSAAGTGEAVPSPAPGRKSGSSV